MWSYFFLLWDPQDGQVRNLTTKTRIRILTLKAKKNWAMFEKCLQPQDWSFVENNSSSSVHQENLREEAAAARDVHKNLPGSSDVSRVDAFSLCRKPHKHWHPVWLHSTRLLQRGGHDTQSTDRLVIWPWTGVLAVSTVERNHHI